MPRHEPLGRPTPADIIGANTVKFRRDANGKLVPVVPKREGHATTEAKPEPRDAPDPRSGPMRNIPPYGAGI